MISCWGGLIGLWVLLQVPAPTAGADLAQKLESQRRTILMREAADLSGLAGELAAQGKTEAAKRVLSELPRRESKDGPTRFMPLPEVVEPRNKAQAPTKPAGVEEIRARTAAALFELAGEAARSESGQYALASVCLRGVLSAIPTTRKRGGCSGYVPHGGGWATPFAVGRLKAKDVNHPTFGWVPQSWVEHLDGGELPAPPSRGQKKTRWVPVAEADRLHADWRAHWHFETEHFEIDTNVPLAEAITFGRRLEAFHDLFMTLFADILGENVPIVRLFKNAALQPEAPQRPRLHQVWYFASKAEFVEHLRPRLGDEVALNLGFYDPPKSGRGRVPAYFFRDPDGQIPETATLYHEVSHQLLFETAGPNSYTKNFGNFWVFEGLGTYFETVSPQPDGSLEVGGMVGPRIAEAYQTLVVRHGAVPLAKFIALDESAFRDKIQIYQNYQQAMALTIFLMQWDQGAYRDGFLDYVRDAYHGRIKRGVSRGIQDRLHQPYATLEKQFLTFLKEAKEAQLGPDAPGARPAGGDGIRTVPSR